MNFYIKTQENRSVTLKTGVIITSSRKLVRFNHNHKYPNLIFEGNESSLSLKWSFIRNPLGWAPALSLLFVKVLSCYKHTSLRQHDINYKAQTFHKKSFE